MQEVDAHVVVFIFIVGGVANRLLVVGCCLLLLLSFLPQLVELLLRCLLRVCHLVHSLQLVVLQCCLEVGPLGPIENAWH